ncbi:uncharacterized protein OCT59_025937 [Rhizophagus irregularis]|uniref:Serine-enriched protein n=2 Tax=Rhizophagus irregularis TaxID=588596 RepID=A0A015IJE1_RHIIW|nr:hypothetical protein RirG_236720 [Rhizophagus irregularis DAOM 197198w]UZO05593.1 hypothetical protein OCT59_025937 [Rhizophagus irregularis]
MDDNKFLPKLSQNLLEILEDNEYYDITIEVGNDPYVKIFRAHMVILNYRSPYLRRILSTNSNKNKNDGILTHIKLPNVSPEIFQIILRYIYGGKFSLEEYDNLKIIKILIAANELSLQELIIYLQSFLIENKKIWLEQNFNLIYKMSFENNSFLKLQNFCTEIISKEPEKIFNSIDFVSISEKCLISLIKHNNIQMDDIKVWDHVLKWGIAQSSELSSDLSSYTKDDFNTLKDILKQCIPFIKFYDLTSKEFLDKVYPYKKIIPKELRENLIEYYLNHDHSPIRQKIIKEIGSKCIDSKIITYQHAELISKWINKSENIDKTYEFKLILRGSRDGFLPSKFHEICDNKPHTVSIIKVKDSNEILGGYNPIVWKFAKKYDYGFYDYTKDSFIFSFKNKENMQNYILSRAKLGMYSIYSDFDCGPTFGDSLVLHGNDFYNKSYCKTHAGYEKIIRETEDIFSVEEYEIFQITKE